MTGQNPPCTECGYDGLFNTTELGCECPECGALTR